MEAPPLTLHTTSNPSSIRFLGILKQPDSDSNPFEFDESDVVWSSDVSYSPNSDSPSPRTHRQLFRPDSFGLSAALTDERPPLVRRKPKLNPSLSAASAARTIPPVPVPRSGSSPAKFLQSAPVNVPVWPRTGDRRTSRNSNHRDFDENDEELAEEEEEMLPPHEIVARSHVTTFSVFEGVGRTLKGRDLRRVRNAVFQKTGFLD